MNEKERAVLIQLTNSPEWKVLTNVAIRIVEKISTQANSGETIEEIAIQSIKKDSQIAGIKRLLQEITYIANGEK